MRINTSKLLSCISINIVLFLFFKAPFAILFQVLGISQYYYLFCGVISCVSTLCMYFVEGKQAPQILTLIWLIILAIITGYVSHNYNVLLPLHSLLTPLLGAWLCLPAGSTSRHGFADYILYANAENGSNKGSGAQSGSGSGSGAGSGAGSGSGSGSGAGSGSGSGSATSASNNPQSSSSAQPSVDKNTFIIDSIKSRIGVILDRKANNASFGSTNSVNLAEIGAFSKTALSEEIKQFAADYDGNELTVKNFSRKVLDNKSTTASITFYTNPNTTVKSNSPGSKILDAFTHYLNEKYKD